MSGCVTYIPVEEYTMARAAHEAARDADALRYAPSLWYNAEQAYREGTKSFKDRSYSSAKYSFEQAKIFAEQAENAARVARAGAGDVVP
ncbi:MAG: hypothetical protein AAB250_14570 [Bdellovibrionota bacterium]